MLTQTAVREYQKKITEEYNSINLNIRTLCATTKRNIIKFVNIHNTDHSFEIVGVGGKKESVQNTYTEFTKTKIR
jgi:hypothetical protein